jgi:hypothetical protein
MLSIPLYTVSRSHRVFVADRPRLGTFVHIRNLSMNMYFSTFPDILLEPRDSYSADGWIRTCNTLASMTSIRYLCIVIIQEDVPELYGRHSRPVNADIAGELLRPLRYIRIAKGGVFDVIAQGWNVADEVVDGFPFKVIQERPPSVADLMSRTHELGEFSQDSYVKLASMPWPLHFRPDKSPPVESMLPASI